MADKLGKVLGERKRVFAALRLNFFVPQKKPLASRTAPAVATASTGSSTKTSTLRLLP
jgi:hypothetical protein